MIFWGWFSGGQPGGRFGAYGSAGGEFGYTKKRPGGLPEVDAAVAGKINSGLWDGSGLAVVDLDFGGGGVVAGEEGFFGLLAVFGDVAVPGDVEAGVVYFDLFFGAGGDGGGLDDSFRAGGFYSWPCAGLRARLYLFYQ